MDDMFLSQNHNKVSSNYKYTYTCIHIHVHTTCSCVHVCVLTSIEQIMAATVKKIVEKLTIGQTIAITSVGMK